MGFLEFKTTATGVIWSRCLELEQSSLEAGVTLVRAGPWKPDSDVSG